ncbi:unnamed protein product, partial [Prorocentrum cordatum]
VLWRALGSNMYGATGGEDIIREMNLRFALADYRVWWQREDVELSYRLVTLTMAMLGAEHIRKLKTKAAKTWVLVRLATTFCEKHLGRFEGADVLGAAGQALLSYTDLLRPHGRRIPWDGRQSLLDLCLRHMFLLGQVGSPETPKSHLFARLTQGIPNWGDPKYDSTLLDESLNLTMAVIASVCHRLTWEISMFDCMRLIPHLVRNGAWVVS